MKIIDCQQGTAEWHAARHGFVTGSRCADVMAFLKTGKGERSERRNYRTELILEILTGKKADHFVTPAMERGTMLEPEARMQYEEEMDCLVETIGFAHHETVPMFGASPDGLIGTDGGLEIKCPLPETHMDWCLAGVLPEKHYWQCMAGMSVCEREWWDFASYYPDAPKAMRLFIVRVPRDDKKIADLQAGVVQFRGELEAEIARLEERFGKMPRPLPVIPQRGEDLGDMAITDDDVRWIQQQQGRVQ